MANRLNKSIFEMVMGALTPMAVGAITIGVPRSSSWIKVVGVESFTATLTATGTANGTWTVQGSQSDDLVKPADSIVETGTLPEQPTYPTGVAGTGDVVIPTWGYRWIRVTFNPTAGAGNSSVTFKGRITGSPIDLAQDHMGSIQLFVAAADTLAGQFKIECSNNWSGIFQGSKGGGKVIADGRWIDALPSPAIAALVASTGQDRLVRLGISTDGADGVIEYGGVRVVFTWSAGFGSPAAYGIFKGF